MALLDWLVLKVWLDKELGLMMERFEVWCAVGHNNTKMRHQWQIQMHICDICHETIGDDELFKFFGKTAVRDSGALYATEPTEGTLLLREVQCNTIHTMQLERSVAIAS